MDLTPLLSHRPVKAEDLPLDRLVSNTHVPEQEKIAAAGRAFEALLLRQVLTEAQKPAFPSKFSNDSATNGIYRDMVVEQLADNMAKSNTLGLAQTLTAALQRQRHLQSPASPTAGPNAPAAPDATALKSAPAAPPTPKILRSPKDAAEHAAMALPDRVRPAGPHPSAPAPAAAKMSAPITGLSDPKPLPLPAVEITSDD
jgi:Rod binding domain-containing protein